MADGDFFGRREPPANPEAEQALLGVLMQHGARSLDRVSAIVRPEHFYTSVHGVLYTAIQGIIERGAAPDPVTVASVAKADPLFEMAGGIGYIASLYATASSIPSGGSTEMWAQDIRRQWQRRRAIELADEMIAVAHDGDGEINEAMAAIQRALDDVSAGGGGETYKHISVYYHEANAAADEAKKRQGQVVGVTTGLTDLDRTIGGLQKGDLIICGARPGMGKSALGVCIARSAALSGAKVGIWSLEMPGQQIGGRSEAIDTGIAYTDIRAGRIEDNQWPMLADAAYNSANLPIYVDPTPAIRPSWLSSTARRLKRRHGLDLVIVDYLQLMRGDTTRRDGNKVQEISEITGALKAMAKELDVPVLAFSQLNRAVEQREDRRPMLSDLRDSGSIEQDADIVMFLYRQEYYLQKEGRPVKRTGELPAKFGDRLLAHDAALAECEGVGEIIVAKQRNGPENTIRAAFDGRLMQYQNLYRGDDR